MHLKNMYIDDKDHQDWLIRGAMTGRELSTDFKANKIRYRVN